MRRVIVSVAGLAALGVLALVAMWWSGSLTADPAAAPELARPPALMTTEELEGRQSLFDGLATTGWEIEGPARVQGGTLALGGEETTRATLARWFEEGEQLEFDFFQEGRGGAKLWIKPILIAPQPPDPEFCKEFSFDLNLSEFTYRRWHNVRVGTSHEGTNTQAAIDIRPHFDERGRGGGANHSLPARGGCRYQFVFEVAPGATLYLRNVLRGGTPRREAP